MYELGAYGRVLWETGFEVASTRCVVGRISLVRGVSVRKVGVLASGSFWLPCCEVRCVVLCVRCPSV